MTDLPEPSSSPFAALADFVALPRVSGLVLSPDGSRLVTTVATLDAERVDHITSLWEVDPTGRRPARRLTRGAGGESAPVFTPAGDLLFLSARPAGALAPGEADGLSAAVLSAAGPGAAVQGASTATTRSLWVLPGGGGEARVLASRPGGLTAPVVASDSGAIATGSPTLPRAGDAADDAARRAARAAAGTSAVLHASAQVRHWDHDLGPDRTRLLVGSATGAVDDPLSREIVLRDLTGHVGAALGDDATWALTPDGATLVTDWAFPEAGGDSRDTVVAIDVATGERRRLADDQSCDHHHPLISPDGARVVLVRRRRPTPSEPEDARLLVVDLASGQQRPLAEDWDRWPTPLCWTPDGRGVVVVADDGGRAPLFHVDLTTSAVNRLTSDDAAYSDARVSPDGQWVYALRSSVDAPPAPVRFSLAAARAAGGPLAGALAGGGGAAPEPLPGPAHALGALVGAAQLPGVLTEVTATATDGTPLRAWLALPDGASAGAPAPLLLWIHGGPLSSWNAWMWRWNPWLAVARGYAVLLPDPALSTGYGLEFVRRGWNAWGARPYTDLLQITDAAQERPDVDARRAAAMGGSFGGYMANWIAGHTDRFTAIVTHASLWALDQFATTTDDPAYWARALSGRAAQENSPHHHADRITTPMLVIHGDRDDRVPIGEALRLWRDLCARSAQADAGAHRFLYFPDEHHWVLRPGNTTLWYETVFAFLAVHLLGRPFDPPQELG